MASEKSGRTGWRKKKLMVILGTGGHTTEMIKLVDGLGNRYEYVYVIAKEDTLSEGKIRIPGRVYRVTAGVNFSGYERSRVTFLKNVICIFESCLVVVMARASAITSGGGGFAIPFYFWGRLLGKKNVYVEDLSRVYELSRTGSWISRLRIVDKFFVQWRDLKKRVPCAVYGGKLI